MGFIKRAFYSMKYRKGQDIFLMIAYTAIFALTLAILLVYLSVSAQVDWLQKSLGCAVTLRTNVANLALPGQAIRYCEIREEDADAFIDSPYVESYNKIGWIAEADFAGDILPCVREANMGSFLWALENPEYRNGYCLMAPVTQSERYSAFTAYGFSLVEGRHFTAEDTDAVIISMQLAERNGLKIGDQITFTTGPMAKHFYESEDDIQYATLTICGLMDVPDAKMMGYDTGIPKWDPYNLVITSYEATKVLSYMYAPEPSLQELTVYLKSADDMDAFIRETQEKLSIEMVTGSVEGFGTVAGAGVKVKSTEGEKNLQTRYDRFINEGAYYTLFLDREWYDMVAKPLESVRNLMGIFLAVVLVGSAVVLALVVLLSLRGRRKEFGILLAMGEPKWKVVGQIFVEVFVPLFLAAVLGTLLGTRVFVPVAADYSSGLLATQSREEQTDLRSGIRDRDFFYFVENRLLQDDLSNHSFRTIAVVDSVPYEAGVEVYGAYFGFDFAMVVLILLIQLLSILRVKPARILTGRE